MNRIYICFFSFGVIISAADSRIEYFLTDHDFLSNNPSPAQAVIGRNHFLVEFNKNDQIISKIQVDETRKIVKQIVFQYDDITQSLSEKVVYDGINNLISKTIFGQEEHSREFLNYLYNLESVRAFEDRYTQIIYGDDGQPVIYKYFDVNGFNYGETGYFYNANGSMSSQVWIEMPSERIIRRWRYNPIVGTDLTQIMEYDSVGTLIKNVKLNPEGKQEVLTFINPEELSYVNHSRISFTLEGELASGEIIWIENDTIEHWIDSTRIHQLYDQYLLPGSYNLTPPIQLVDGLMYRIIFRGKMRNGNTAIQKKIENVTFDITPPEIQLLMNKRISRPEIAFDSSEPLQSAILKWLPGIYEDTIPSLEGWKWKIHSRNES